MSKRDDLLDVRDELKSLATSVRNAVTELDGLGDRIRHIMNQLREVRGLIEGAESIEDLEDSASVLTEAIDGLEVIADDLQ